MSLAVARREEKKRAFILFFVQSISHKKKRGGLGKEGISELPASRPERKEKKLLCVQPGEKEGALRCT